MSGQALFFTLSHVKNRFSYKKDFPTYPPTIVLKFFLHFTNVIYFNGRWWNDIGIDDYFILHNVGEFFG